MNYYAGLIRDRWLALAPASYAEITDPDEFFAELGETALTTVDRLSYELMPKTADKDYLTQVGLLNAARRQAEELALDDVPWPAVERSPDEEREEWEATRPQEEGFADWLSYIDRPLMQYEITDLAIKWMVSEQFIQEMSEASSPFGYWESHADEAAASQEARYQRFLSVGFLDGEV